jgi:LacI family transcriptional regulator
MRPTIRDVARKLNISITTVSRALDGYKDVAESTRQLVVKTAQEMGYIPNRAARQLRRQRTDTIGYIIPSTSSGFSDPFFSDFLAGLGDEAAAGNYDLLVSCAPPASAEEKTAYQRWVQGGKVDGMIINRVYMNDWRLRYLAERDIPHVSLERSPSQTDFVGIEVDSYAGFLEMVAVFIQHGHRRIAYIGGAPDLKIDHDRLSGYRRALKSAGIQADPDLVIHADLTSEGGYQAAGNLFSLPHPPTAIVCINDLTAMGAMHAAHEHGLDVGRSIAIAGFDGTADSAHTQPPLTTLSQSIYTIARELASMLLALINNDPMEQRQVKIQPRLILRASTGD